MSGGGGGGGSPANTTNVQTIREAPEIEARRLGLMDEATRVARSRLNLPSFQTAGLTREQRAAGALAGQTGVGISSIRGAQTAARQFGRQATQAAGQFGRQATQAATGAGTRAGQFATGAVSAAALDPSSQQFQQYLNPYQQYVIDEIRRQAQMQEQDIAKRAISSGAFGGGREGIQRAELQRATQANIGQEQQKAFLGALGAFQQGQQLQAQTGLAAGQQALAAGQLGAQTALSAGQLGAQTQLEAGQLGAQTGLSAADALMRQRQADIQNLSTTGATAQATEQARLDALRQTRERAIQDPYTRLSFVSDIQRGVPSSQQAVTQTAAPTTSPAAQALGTGLGAYAAFAGK